MNTSKQINIMVALVFIAVLATGAYTMWDPDRTSDARKDELSKTVERGAFLFAQNCVVCHGNKAEGGVAANRLKQAPALNRDDLQGKKDGVVSEQDKLLQFKFIVNTITCGRIGKAMPTWGQSQGGTLNDEQIRQLATMITEGTGWDRAREFAIDGFDQHHIHYTGYASAGITLTKALDASGTTVYVSNVDLAGKGSRLEIGADLSDEKVAGELLLVTDVLKSVIALRGSNAQSHDAKSSITGPDGVLEGVFLSKAADASSTEIFINNTSKLQEGEVIKIGDESMTISQITEPRLTVERGLGSTSPKDHAEGAAVWLPPVPPDPPPVTQPACGQNLPPTVPTAGPTAPSTDLKITAQGTAWDVTTLTGVAGQELTLTYENKDSGIAHNIHFFKGADASGADVAQTDIGPGPETLTLKFGPLDAGEYYYHCDVHPGQMEGALTTVAAGAAPAGGAAATTTAAVPAPAAATPAATAAP